MESADQTWAIEEFGCADVGDVRRTRRLVAVAAAAATRPAGRVTEVIACPAEQTAAFRLLGNDAATPDEIAQAANRACALRAKDLDFVFVPVDGSSLNLSDWARCKDLGILGARCVGATGLQVMSAIAVAPEGTPLGLCGQIWWARKGRARMKGQHDRRLVASKETQHWLSVMKHVREVFAEHAPATQPWFQLDRGGDAWAVLLEGLHPGQLFTVRAAYDRRLLTTDDEPRRYLWEHLESQPELGTYDLDVPARAGRAARVANMEVRTCEVTLSLLDKRTKRHHPATLWAVLATEVGTVPKGEQPIEWLLLTTQPAASCPEAELVLRGYAQRWRIEEFHHLWKTGSCNVEDTQLRDRESIIRWATVLASVAMRILRLTYLARKEPEILATAELTTAEIAAIVATRKPAGARKCEELPIGLVVNWLAEIGGYTGKSSGGPPGAIVISRGLNRIGALADYLASIQKM